MQRRQPERGVTIYSRRLSDKVTAIYFVPDLVPEKPFYPSAERLIARYPSVEQVLARIEHVERFLKATEALVDKFRGERNRQP